MCTFSFNSSTTGSRSRIFLLDDDFMRYFCFISSGSGVYKSSDGGMNFISMQFNSGNPSFGGLYFKDQFTGWAAGDGGSIYKCYYNQWTQIPVATTNNFTGLDFSKEGLNGWVAGVGNEYAHTTDGGSTWNMEGLGFSNQIMYDVKVISPNEAYFVGYASTFYKYIKH